MWVQEQVGEFEKRILTKANEHCKLIDDLAPQLNRILEELDEGVIHINTESMTMKMWDTIRIVREAKKEFLAIPYEVEEHFAKNMPSSVEAIQAYTKRLKQEWFLKWFGDGNIQSNP